MTTKNASHQHRIGNSGADSYKLNISNSIGHLCKCWADVFQMPHHRQYVNRYSQPIQQKISSKIERDLFVNILK